VEWWNIGHAVKLKRYNGFWENGVMAVCRKLSIKEIENGNHPFLKQYSSIPAFQYSSDKNWRMLL
jgi:hypothetical protein